jgi:hypothetical protein
VSADTLPAWPIAGEPVTDVIDIDEVAGKMMSEDQADG